MNYGPSLFDDFSMRKTPKPAMLTSLAITFTYTDYPPDQVVVIDGGHMLRASVWDVPCTYREILEGYVIYLKRRFKDITAVLDGYGAAQTTKSVEHKRRATGKTSIDIDVFPDNYTTTTQEEFLTNDHNKNQLTQHLVPCLRSHNISVVQARADADAAIVDTAIEKAKANPNKKVSIVSRDTDVPLIAM